MTTIDYTLTTDQLSNAIDNTIRAFNEYSLRKKRDNEGRQLIIDRSWMGKFNYFIIEIPGGSQLTLEAVTAKPVSREELAEREESFLKNLYKVIDKEIMITTEIANRNVYKRAKVGIGLRSIILIVIIILLIIKTVQWCTKS
ncbi:MAG TPA: hypothetical protein VGZ90_11340 [Puia sp.]|jgi:hypothetical protein|nr:hypothetical protein [Puia sp.]